LHWAAKRNHSQVVEYLLANGADKTIEANNKSTPANVCTNQHLRDLLQTSSSSSETISSSTSLPIIPNYLRHPVFPYVTPSTSSSSAPINLDDTTTANITPHHQQNSVTLLCRIADDPTETDFVEFDFTKQPIDGSYDRLVSLVSQELEFEIDHVEKLRRLPCIRIRNDRDVQRLKDNHMIEVRIKKTDEHV